MVALGDTRHLRCFRCLRDLPQAQFGQVNSITAIHRGASLFHPLCWLCRKQAESQFAKHRLYTPALHRFVHQLMTSVRSGASARGILVAINDDDVLGLYMKQEGRCAITGETMTYRRGTRQAKERHAVSVDRVNSQRNYTIDNIHLVCRIVNLMKSDMPLEEFGWWCQRIVLNNLQSRPETTEA